MNTILHVMDLVLATLRPVLLGAATVAGVICLVDWLVRTRRIGPFSPVARFFRTTVEPLMLPIEQRIVRSGGLPAHAPWWALAAVVVGGIILISVLQFLQEQLVRIATASSMGTGSVFTLMLFWAFEILKFAILVRVIASWIPGWAHSRWVRWAFVLTEPILKPLRMIIPAVGPFDITPIAAYFLIALIEQFVLR